MQRVTVVIKLFPVMFVAACGVCLCNTLNTSSFRILSTVLEGGIIHTQELPLVISTVSDGFAGHLFVWDFVKESWDRIIEK